MHTSSIPCTLIAGLDQLHDVVSVLRSQSSLRKTDVDPVPLDILIFQELDRSLRRRHSTRGRQIASSKGA
jgi:hypothetical protein